MNREGRANCRSMLAGDGLSRTSPRQG